MMRFKVYQFVKEYVQKTEEEWGYVEVRQKYTCHNYDDLQNLLLTIIENSTGSVKFQIEKEEVEDDE